jgi:hypothetical protein
MTLNSEITDWRILAERASKEMDGEKLSDLVTKLCAALDNRVVSGKSLRGTLKVSSIEVIDLALGRDRAAQCN